MTQSQEVIRPSEARRYGLTHFFTDKPCKRGHIALRYTKGGQCIDCMSENKRKPITPRARSTENLALAKISQINGGTTYTPTKPCPKGHLLRFVSSNNCVVCDNINRDFYKDSRKFKRIEKEYGLTREQYYFLVKKQWSCCKICGKYEPVSTKLHIDHCHYTKKVRGLLCNKCNQALGLLNHSKQLMEKAIVYLDD